MGKVKPKDRWIENKVYDWENVFLRYRGENVLSRMESEYVVTECAKTFAVKPPTIHFNKTDFCEVRPRLDRWTITLPHWGCTARKIIHAMALFSSNRRAPFEEDTHGETYVAHCIILYSKLLGIRVDDLLEGVKAVGLEVKLELLGKSQEAFDRMVRLRLF